MGLSLSVTSTLVEYLRATLMLTLMLTLTLITLTLTHTHTLSITFKTTALLVNIRLGRMRLTVTKPVAY